VLMRGVRGHRPSKSKHGARILSLSVTTYNHAIYIDRPDHRSLLICRHCYDVCKSVATPPEPPTFLVVATVTSQLARTRERYARADCSAAARHGVSFSCLLASPLDGERKRGPGRHTSQQRSADKSTALPRSQPASQRWRRRR
jgi:hypothetical protein